MRTLEVSRALNVLQAYMLEESVGEQEFVEAREKAKVEITRILNDDLATGGSDSVFGDVFADGIEYDSDGKPRPAGLVVDREIPLEDSNFTFPGLEPPVG